MLIIVHVGAPKTGSSAIQEYLYAMREPLADEGIVYPDLDHPSHWKLAHALGSQMARPGGEPRSTYLARRADQVGVDGTLEKVTATIRSASDSGEVVILSHEIFSSRHGGRLRAFLKNVAPQAQVHAIGYIRNPVSHYPSSLQQLLKTPRPLIVPSRFVSNHPGRAAETGKGFEQAHLRLFDRRALRKGDVVEDFRQLVANLTGRALPAQPTAIATNPAMSGPACALLLRHLRAFPHDEDESYRALRSTLMEFGSERAAPGLVASPPIADVVAANNHEAWNKAVLNTEHDEETKTRALITPPAVQPRGQGMGALRRWVDTYFDPAFNADLIEFSKMHGRRRSMASLTDWIERQR